MPGTERARGAHLRGAVLRRLEPLLVVVLLAGSLCSFGPWWEVYEFDPDEGLNLGKALLVARGHELCAEVWSDQPPLFTWALALLVRLVGPSVTAARLLVLGCACLLALGLFRLLARTEGRAAAWAGAVLLLSAPAFGRASVAVMVGLPALALAVLAVALAPGERRRGGGLRPALSGAVFGASLLAKAFTVLLLPVFALVLVRAAQGLRARVRVAGAWCAGLGAVLAAAAAAVGLPAEQLWSPHLGEATARVFAERGGFAELGRELAQRWHLLVLAALALWGAAGERRWPRAAALVWLLVAAAALGLHRPLWWHHLLLLEVPLVWLGGAGLGAVLGRLGCGRGSGLAAGRGRLLAAGVLGAALALGAAGAARSSAELRSAFAAGATAQDQAVLEMLGVLGRGVRWVLTDRPMDAFRAGLVVPPPLAVLSRKRLLSGQLEPQELFAALERYRPEVVSLRRFRWRGGVLRRLLAHYRPVVQGEGWRLYVRRAGL
ncbi:MAG: hypothetical protein KatS3mg102_1391 [Planctomycetota bacterium]|nr:MAG: hypothetical protein KatS3mg102_1391 [Planctomycetota bacterium]